MSTMAMKKFKFFSKSESLGILLILVFIFLISLYNFNLSLRRARDVQRRDDLTALAQGLEKFYNDFGVYPPATSEGKIVACPAPGVTQEDLKKIIGNRPEINRIKIFPKLAGCEWGASVLTDPSDPSITPYLSVIPKDSHASEGASYKYFSTGKHFQIYGAYEGNNMPEHSRAILTNKITCGINICNFGKASRGTPLDKSLEEYENELSK
jgi:hypothetical protein